MGSHLDLERLDAAAIQAAVERALAGDAATLDALTRALAPVVQVRVARALLRRAAGARGRNLRADLEDLVQEVFAVLFTGRGRALRAWDPSRGLSFLNFIGFLAEREVGMLMRTSKRNPWTEDPTPSETLQAMQPRSASHQAQLEARDLLEVLCDRLRERLTPQGRLYFQRLYVEERSIESVASEAGTTSGALYAWRARFKTMLRELEAEISGEGR